MSFAGNFAARCSFRESKYPHPTIAFLGREIQQGIEEEDDSSSKIHQNPSRQLEDSHVHCCCGRSAGSFFCYYEDKARLQVFRSLQPAFQEGGWTFNKQIHAETARAGPEHQT